MPDTHSKPTPETAAYSISLDEMDAGMDREARRLDEAERAADRRPHVEAAS